jgi:hypothetical protein
VLPPSPSPYIKKVFGLQQTTRFPVSDVAAFVGGGVDSTSGSSITGEVGGGAQGF